MSDSHGVPQQADLAPGDQEAVSVKIRVLGYLVGLGLAVLLTATSFFIAGTDLVWQPSIPVAIIVLAIAQMGVHLVFFLHITTVPITPTTCWRSPSASDRVSGDRRVAVDHGEPERAHDADGPDRADAALSRVRNIQAKRGR